MKRKPTPTRATRENPEWTKATFERARAARHVLPELVGDAAARRLLKPRGQVAPETGR